MLKENIDVWLVRGMVALLIQNSITAQTKEYVKMLMNRRSRLEIIITHHFFEEKE
jgi:hypothetical protein